MLMRNLDKLAIYTQCTMKHKTLLSNPFYFSCDKQVKNAPILPFELHIWAEI